MELLRTQREAILAKWVALAFRPYPTDATPFLAEEPDPFRNPVGHTFRRHMAALLDELLGSMDTDRLGALLDPLVRIRAVQDLGASAALEFLAGLKPIIRDAVRETERASTVRMLEARIDRLHVIAAERFARCRADLDEVRAHERARRTWVQQRMDARTRSEVQASGRESGG